MEIQWKNRFISNIGEDTRTESLIDKIKQDWWVDDDTIIINCLPEYSSRLSHSLSHILSSLNNNEIIDVINLNIPYPNMSQVRDISKAFEYTLFDIYLRDWMIANVRKGVKYLFNSLLTLDGKSLKKIEVAMKSRLHNDFRFSAMYMHYESHLIPDYYVEEYKERPIFSWENTNNKSL